MRTSKVTLMLFVVPVFVISLACSAIGKPNTPQEPTSSIYATSIAVGGTHACALLNNGHVVCWGENSSGQLGDGTYTKQTKAVSVVELTDAIAIATGGEHTCAVTKSGGVKCWGENSSGQLGNGAKTMSKVPVDVTGLTNVKAISAGGEHTCAVINDGSVKCWGKNLFGRVGNGSNTRLVLSPANVVELGTSVINVFAGGEHTCALTSDRNIKCWGNNGGGELGNGSDKHHSTTPTDVVGFSGNVATMAIGFAKTCAITDDGKLKCWGWVTEQQFSDSPVEPGNFSSKAKLVAEGFYHICVVLENGTVMCMGGNEDGQLGIGSTAESQKFMDVRGLEINVIAIGAAFNSTCALSSAGEVFCWGRNISGQLGNGTTENSTTPVKVIGINQ